MDVPDYPYLFREPIQPSPGERGLPRAILQKHRDSDISCKMVAKDGGYLYNIDGRTYFSPNCNRPNVQPPPPLSSVHGGVLQGRDYQFPDICKPQWWTKAHGYLAFLPLRPKVSQPPFHPLLHIPNVVYDSDRGIPVPEQKIWSSWQKLQSQIAEAIHLLLFSSGAAAVRPAYPCARVDAKVALGKRLTREAMRGDIYATFSWFAVWLGCLSYAIAVSEAMSNEAERVSIRRLPGWVETLLNGSRELKDHSPNEDLACEQGASVDEMFISDLQNTCVSRFDGSVERAGTFVSIPENDEEDTVSIDWLCEMGVPVWYEWGQREEEIASKNAFWRRYAPSPDALQLCSPPMAGHSDSGPTISANENAPDVEPQSPEAVFFPELQKPADFPRRPEPTLEERTWEAHFKERTIRRSIILSQETTTQKIRRENRERCPPTNPRKTHFYIWESNSLGKGFVRRRAEKDDMDDIFTEDGRFGRQQARYDSVYNEWDLCEYFGPPDENQLEYMAETWAQYEGTTYEKQLSRCRAYYGLGPAQEDPKNNLQQAPDPTNAAEDPSESDSCVLSLSQREIPEMVHELFGYTCSLARLGHWSPSSSPRVPLAPSTSTALGLVPKVLGISKLVPRSDPFWKSPEGQGVVEFVKSLATASQSTTGSWDLTLSSPIPVVTLPRFKLLRRSMVPAPTYIKEWDNIRGQHISLTDVPQETFWFASDHGQQWFVGCVSPVVALMICRLDQSLVHPLAISRALLDRGVRFQTWKLVPIPPQIKLLSRFSYSAKFRSQSYQYSKEDYENYVRSRRDLLTGSAGRAALLRGGLAWRLAIEDTSFDDVFSGPSCEAHQGCGVMRGTGSGAYLIDDDLSADELDCLCGMYDHLIDDGQLADHQVGRVSWWPPIDIWESLFGGWGWSPDAEKHYNDRMSEIERDYTPLPRSEWKRKFKRSSALNHLGSYVEGKAREVIINRAVQ